MNILCLSRNKMSNNDEILWAKKSSLGASLLLLFFHFAFLSIWNVVTIFPPCDWYLFIFGNCYELFMPCGKKLIKLWLIHYHFLLPPSHSLFDIDITWGNFLFIYVWKIIKLFLLLESIAARNNKQACEKYPIQILWKNEFIWKLETHLWALPKWPLCVFLTLKVLFDT